jgi:hypothetical protein
MLKEWQKVTSGNARALASDFFPSSDEFGACDENEYCSSKGANHYYHA